MECFINKCHIKKILTVLQAGRNDPNGMSEMHVEIKHNKKLRIWANVNTDCKKEQLSYYEV